MYAVLKTGGKQYRVEPGTLVDVERIDGNVGETVEFGDVLLTVNSSEVQVGQPIVHGATVSAEIIEHKRGRKLIIFKKIRRHGKRLKKGHRQELTRIRIKDIVIA